MEKLTDFWLQGRFLMEQLRSFYSDSYKAEKCAEAAAVQLLDPEQKTPQGQDRTLEELTSAVAQVFTSLSGIHV